MFVLSRKLASRFCKGLAVSLLLPAFFVFAADDSQDADWNIYKILPGAKSLLTSPQFEVIDDFNNKAGVTKANMKNRYGFLWTANVPSKNKLRLEIVKLDGRSSRKSGALQGKFSLKPKTQVGMISRLGSLDMSAAKYIAAKCRIETSKRQDFMGRIRLTLRDQTEKGITYDITRFCHINRMGWGDVILPMTIFKSLDLNALSSVEFAIISSDKLIEGTIFLDEITFFGENQVNFDSKRDDITGFPLTVFDESKRKKLASYKKESFLLKEIAKDTWKYFANARSKKTNLVLDHIRTGDAPLAADYTSITNIALDILAAISADKLGIISKKAALQHIDGILSSLEKLDRWKGFFYNFYNVHSLNATKQFVSTVDNGWLAVSLVVLRQTYSKEFSERANEILKSIDFNELLDPENNQFVIGYDREKQEMTSAHYGLISSEARIVSLYAIGSGSIPSNQWWFLYRTPPEAWKWQKQNPKGKITSQDGIDYFQGYYEYKGKKIIPSWGGSLFEFLMPTMIIQEQKLAPDSLGINNKIATEVHIDYALKEKGYPVWGMSPCGITDGKSWRYVELGVPSIAVKGYPDRPLITPHVSFLALETMPAEAFENIRKFLGYNLYGEYGLYDSINLRNGRVNTQYLALDQGMILVALCNHMKKGVIQKKFHNDPVGKNIESLLSKESFFS